VRAHNTASCLKAASPVQHANFSSLAGMTNLKHTEKKPLLFRVQAKLSDKVTDRRMMPLPQHTQQQQQHSTPKLQTKLQRKLKTKLKTKVKT
jgi:hypothetical protein